MICYAVIDTNVLVSALLSANDDAATVQVLKRLINGDIIPIFSEKILGEYSDVLNRKKFNFPKNEVKYILSAIEHFGRIVDPAHIDAILPDMKDLPFYEVVMEKRTDNAYLVTGNLKHFPSEPFIVTPRQMINILDGVE